MAKRIMVVDDERNLRLLYKKELGEEGYDVVLAESGKQAIELAREAPVDLIVMDIRMPGMDGLEAINKLMAIDKSLPIVINSAYSNYKDDFASWTADAYVVKSADLTELKTRIRELLDH